MRIVTQLLITTESALDMSIRDYELRIHRPPPVVPAHAAVLEFAAAVVGPHAAVDPCLPVVLPFESEAASRLLRRELRWSNLSGLQPIRRFARL